MNSNAFLYQAIRHPLSIGAIAPSSQNLCNLVLEHADLDSATSVVELGPGTGSFTRKILNQLDDSVPYLGIERNECFAKKLVEQFSAKRIAQGSAENLTLLLEQNQIAQCNRVISGLPWMTLPEPLQDSILSEVGNTLSADGLFLTYAYFPFYLSPKGRHFHKKLKRHFKQVTKTKMVLNFPPAFVYVCSQAVSSENYSGV